MRQRLNSERRFLLDGIILIANQFQAKMPVDEIPEKTDGYGGFVHLMQSNGSIEESTLGYIIRYFDRETFEVRKQLMIETADNLRNDYGENAVTLEIQDQYFNMGEKIEPVMDKTKNLFVAVLVIGAIMVFGMYKLGVFTKKA